MLKAVAVGIIVLGLAASAFAELGDVVAELQVPGDGNHLAGLAISNDALYANHYKEGRIYRMNADTGVIYGSFPAAAGEDTRGLAYVWGGYLYQTQGYDSPYYLYRTRYYDGRIEEAVEISPSYCHGIAPLATGDGGEGTNIIIISKWYDNRVFYKPIGRSIYKVHNVPVSLYEIAYDWRNGLIWGGMNSNVVYGLNSWGSAVSSFTYPGANVYGIAYWGQYLWVGETAGNIYKVHCPGPGTDNIAPASIGKIKAIYR